MNQITKLPSNYKNKISSNSVFEIFNTLLKDAHLNSLFISNKNNFSLDINKIKSNNYSNTSYLVKPFINRIFKRIPSRVTILNRKLILNKKIPLLFSYLYYLNLLL